MPPYFSLLLFILLARRKLHAAHCWVSGVRFPLLIGTAPFTPRRPRYQGNGSRRRDKSKECVRSDISYDGPIELNKIFRPERTSVAFKLDDLISVMPSDLMGHIIAMDPRKRQFLIKFINSNLTNKWLAERRMKKGMSG